MAWLPPSNSLDLASLAYVHATNRLEQLFTLVDGKAKNMRSVTGEPAMASAFGQSQSPNDTKVAALEQELEILRKAFGNAIRLLKASRSELRKIRKEALCTAEEYRASNDRLVAVNDRLEASKKDLVDLNCHLRELLERSRPFVPNPHAAVPVDLRPLFSAWSSDAARTGVAFSEKQGDTNRLTAWHEKLLTLILALRLRRPDLFVENSWVESSKECGL